MVMVQVDTIAAYRRISGSSRLAWSKGWRTWRPPDAVLHSSNELSQWLCHDDSTV